MLSYFHRLPQVELLYEAWRKLSKKKHSRGFDQQTIEEFGNQIDHNIRQLSRELRSGRFEFTPLLGCLLEKPGRGKRPLKIPGVRDRVVLKAIHILIAHKFRRYDLPCSFGYIRRVSTADAVRRVRELAAEGKKWVLEGDISKFFDTVDRSVLADRFLREIRIPSLENLISRAISVEIGNLDAFSPFLKDMFPRADSGIPQGGVLSPLLANFYLYPFDRAMSDAGFDLVRYADDFVVLCPSEERAHEAYSLAQSVLRDNLRLLLHPIDAENSKTKITLYSKGFTFLGQHFQGGLVRPSSKAIKKFRERVSTIADPRKGFSLLSTLSSLKHLIDGWAHAYCSYDSLDEFRTLDQHVRQEVSRFMGENCFMLPGRLPSSKQMRFLGLPSMESILLPKSNPADAGRDIRAKVA
jgi:RNA-directed DNA polymerase